ncbi:ATP-binding protein [Flavobacterium lindanitolerans]|uniref:ATP-binding protein n=1 Tax=Flavobacterium lindanitolerans TaxID=428988 RepID=UPI0028090B91|nr:ATP-binding protein [Flavobacterium lindanitolerans]MDQ7960504.1 ATP-binding protein [Flavobacterium lindanitolerans]
MSTTKIGQVLESSPNSILIEVSETSIFETHKKDFQIGKYLEIAEGNLNKVVAVIQNIKSNASETGLKFVIQTQPIGYIENNEFNRGAALIPSPTEPVTIVDSTTIDLIYNSNKNFNFPFGKLVQNKSIDFKIDANKFFGKHVALVGSTGSGKSCTVAKILQDAVGINSKKNINTAQQKNAHIIIFDIHSEYKSAFDLHVDEKFNLNVLDSDTLKLPYWLMNSEELEALFIEGNENNHHNQVSQFKKAVILNKEKHNPSLKDRINYDTPVFFDINEVFNYIQNINNLTVYNDGGKTYLATLVEPKIEFNVNQLWNVINFEESTANSKHEKLGVKVSKSGGFNGEFDRFISRLETKLSDKRLNFILNPKKDDETAYKTEDFGDILKQFLGYLDKSNVTIIDLSGIPFEVLSITVSLVSRLVFDFAFHYSKIKHLKDEQNDIPFMIVCEEAHNYIPKTGGAEYKASKKSIERIAKEGRKYGLSLMVVSQRPSEVSETIFSQCNNFISLRLTNVNDQSYVKALMPENSNAIADILPNLGAGECLVVGDATLIPSVVKLDMPDPQPKSQSVKFQDEWQKNWKDVGFEEIIRRWKKED